MRRSVFWACIVNPIVETNALGPALEFKYENSMAEALKPVAVRGGGVAWLPEIAIHTELASGALVQAGGPEHEKKVSVRLYRAIERSRSDVERIWAYASSRAESA